jgi:integration host factor subunit alpha
MSKMTITKAKLAEYLSNSTGFSHVESRKCVEGFLDVISDFLVQGLSVKLYGFGNFVLLDKPARVGRNPKNMEEVVISARRVVSFRAGKKLKKRIEHDGA